MSIESRLASMEKAITNAEKVVAVMENQKKELDALLKEYGFDSVEELESAVEGLSQMVDEQSANLNERLDVLESKLQELDD